MRRDALESRADRGMRAYVTGAVTTRANSSVAYAPLRTHRLAAAFLGVGLGRRPATRRRCSAGAAAAQVATREGSGERDGPRRYDGDARLRTSEPRMDIAPLPLP